MERGGKMKKYPVVLFLLSFLLLILIYIFPLYSINILLISFSISLLIFFGLWNQYPNYSYPIYLCFLLRILYQGYFGESLVILYMFNTYLLVFTGLANHFRIYRSAFWKKFNVLNLIELLILIISLISSYPLYYFALIFNIIFIFNSHTNLFMLAVCLNSLNKNKIVVSNPSKFIELSRVNNLIFTKTGVLTLGDFHIQNLVTSKPKLFWKYLSYAEATRDNRIASFIRSSSDFQKIDLSKRDNYYEFDNGIYYQLLGKNILVGNRELLLNNGIDVPIIDGMGTFIYVAENKKLIGYLILSDKICMSTGDTIKKFKKMNNLHLVTFSKDQEKLTTSVSRTLGIRDSYGNLNDSSASFWLYYIRCQHGRKVAIISDTVNNYMTDISIKLSSDSSCLDKCDIMVIGKDIELGLYLFKLSYFYNSFKSTVSNILVISQILLVILGLLMFSRIWMIVFFQVLVMIMLLVYSIFMINKSMKG